MDNTSIVKEYDEIRNRILREATKLFLKNGYEAVTIRGIASTADLTPMMVQNHFSAKEDILCTLVKHVFDKQFLTAEKLVEGITEDKILLYAVDTVLQLHMAEVSEASRNLYITAYSMPRTIDIIRKLVTSRLEVIFKDYFPEARTQDFFRRKIASGGVMWGFMTTPCDMWFTMDMKVESFLETLFLIYKVPEEKIQEALDFVKKFDFPAIARQAIDDILKFDEAQE